MFLMIKKEFCFFIWNSIRQHFFVVKSVPGLSLSEENNYYYTNNLCQWEEVNTPPSSCIICIKNINLERVAFFLFSMKFSYLSAIVTWRNPFLGHNTTTTTIFALLLLILSHSLNRKEDKISIKIQFHFSLSRNSYRFDQ